MQKQHSKLWKKNLAFPFHMLVWYPNLFCTSLVITFDIALIFKLQSLLIFLKLDDYSTSYRQLLILFLFSTFFSKKTDSLLRLDLFQQEQLKQKSSKTLFGVPFKLFLVEFSFVSKKVFEVIFKDFRKSPMCLSRALSHSLKLTFCSG